MIIGIVGPTGSGKSALGISLAKEINGEIISCDSVQVYKGFDIGSGKVTNEEMDGIKHYLLDIKDGNESFSVSDFISLAEKLVKDIEGRGKVPIIVGGTGLYYRAFAYRYVLSEEKSSEEEELRNKYNTLLKEKGVEYLYSLLISVDPESSKIIDVNHSSRIIRALVYYYSHEKSISEQNISALGLRKDLIGVYLDVERELLYRQINHRVDEMIAHGLIDEVKGLLESGVLKDASPMKTIGYKEIVKYLEGAFSLEEAIENMKKSSRNYAKRQITWFRRHKELYSFEYKGSFDQKKIVEFIKGKLIK